jgi:hypothetical protein
MQFEVSETINGCDPGIALSLVEQQFRKVSGHVVRSDQNVTATGIEASFGSINRSSRAVCSVRSNGSKGIITAEVEYKPSFAFWVFFIPGLFTLLGWLLPLAFYVLQKNTVRAAVEAVFQRVKNECEFNDFSAHPERADVVLASSLVSPLSPVSWLSPGPILSLGAILLVSGAILFFGWGPHR